MQKNLLPMSSYAQGGSADGGRNTVHKENGQPYGCSASATVILTG